MLTNDDGEPHSPPTVPTTKKLDSWITTALDRTRKWKERRAAVTQIGTLVSELRLAAFDQRNPESVRQETLGSLSKLLPHFASKGLPNDLLNVATNTRLGEALTRTAAWVLSEINDWPDRLNQKAFYDNKLRKATAIDASLVFLPETARPNLDPATTEDIGLALKFLPHLDGKGFELFSDTQKYYVGPFFRILNYPGRNKAQKCIQYLYIWSVQVWPISAFFTFFLWPLLAAVAAIPWLLNGSPIAQVIMILLAAVMIVIGIFRTLRPPEMKCFKNDTFHLVGGSLLLAALFFLPYGALIPLAAAIILLLVRKYVLKEIEHVMDYAPVFVYVKKVHGNWHIDRVRIDKFHYEALELGGKRVGEPGYGDPSEDLNTHLSPEDKKDEKDRQLYLETDNVWHSFRFAKHHSSHFDQIERVYLLLWICIYTAAGALVGFDVLKHLFPAIFQFWPDVGVFVLLAGPSILGLIFLNEAATIPISDPSDQSLVSEISKEHSKWVLGRTKLAHLWNMSDDKANLIIRKKLQNPWRSIFDTPFWKTFRDPSAERLAYEALSEVSALEKVRTRRKRKAGESSLGR